MAHGVRSAPKKPSEFPTHTKQIIRGQHAHSSELHNDRLLHVPRHEQTPITTGCPYLGAGCVRKLGRFCHPARPDDVRRREDAGPDRDHADFRDPLLLHDDRRGPVQPVDQADSEMCERRPFEDRPWNRRSWILRRFGW
ncbi:hypothetical protein D3C76_1280360 [compost metagenome]